MEKSLTFVYTLKNKVYINLTNRCSNNCDFCIRHNGSGVENSTLWLEREPTTKEVIDLIDKIDIDFDEAIFCGYGESTYKMDELIAVAKHINSLGKKTRLNTNGLGNAINDRDIVPDLKDNIDYISISLNESNAEKYQAICKSRFGLKSYDLILDFASACVKAKINTTFTVVDVIGSLAVEECRQTAKKIGANFRVRELITDNETYT